MSNYTYVGLWDDFDLDPAFRKVVTVPTQIGTILITILAIIVTFTANRSWKIWRFCLHALLQTRARRSTEQDCTVLRRPQTVLRNSETTGGAFLSLLGIANVKHTTPRARPISIALIVFTLLHWGAFLALGIVTTQVKLSNIVHAISTDDCGVWLPLAPVNRTATLDMNTITSSELRTNTTVAAENYVRNCYSATSATISECNVFARRMLSHTTQMVSCPLLDPSLCSEADQRALTVQSDNISWSDLGVNWKYAKEIYIRRRSVYTPILAEPFLYSTAASRSYVNQNFRSEPPIREPEQIQVFSFFKDEDGSNLTQTYRRNSIGIEYDVLTSSVANGSFLHSGLKSKQLGPEVTIIAIRGQTVTFPAPSDDALFYAQVESTVSMTNGNLNRTITSYAMGRQLNALLVQDMVEVCSKLTGYCSGWIGPGRFSDAMTAFLPRLMGPNFRSDFNTSIFALDIVALPLMAATTNHAILYRGASALQATRTLQNARQYMISDGQWKIEAQNWFRISLALLQMAPQRMVYTPELDRSRVEKLGFFAGPWACSSVKFRSSGHVTLSFVGILVILVTCVVLTIVSYLDDILRLFPFASTSSVLQCWDRDGYLQLLEESDVTQDGIHETAHPPKLANEHTLDSEKLMSPTYETYR